MNTIKTQANLDIAYNKVGEGKPTLIFTHGWVNNQTVWRHEVKQLKKSYECVTYDIRGHGESSKPQKQNTYTLENFSQDLDELIEKLHIQEYILIGHSMGGMISMYHEATRKKAKALVLIDTTSNLNIYDFDKITSILKKLISHIPEFDNRKLLAKTEVTIHPYTFMQQLAFLEGLRNTPMYVVMHCLDMMVNMNLDEEAKKIKVPTLIIHGEKDMTLSPVHGKHIKKLIPQATLKLYKNDNHLVPLNNPKKLIEDIKSFLKNALD